MQRCNRGCRRIGSYGRWSGATSSSTESLKNSARQKTCGSEEDEETDVLLYRRSTEFSSRANRKKQIDARAVRQDERREKVMDFLSDEFLQKYPNIKKYLELRRNNPESVAEMFNLLDLATSYSQYMKHMREFLHENNSVNGRDYLDYALELHRDFEKEKLKNGLSNR